MRLASKRKSKKDLDLFPERQKEGRGEKKPETANTSSPNGWIRFHTIISPACQRKIQRKDSYKRARTVSNNKLWCARWSFATQIFCWTNKGGERQPPLIKGVVGVHKALKINTKNYFCGSCQTATLIPSLHIRCCPSTHFLWSPYHNRENDHSFPINAFTGSLQCPAKPSQKAFKDGGGNPSLPEMLNEETGPAGTKVKPQHSCLRGRK